MDVSGIHHKTLDAGVAIQVGALGLKPDHGAILMAEPVLDTFPFTGAGHQFYNFLCNSFPVFLHQEIISVTPDDFFRTILKLGKNIITHIGKRAILVNDGYEISAVLDQ